MDLHANIGLGWKDSPGRNALAYFKAASVMKKEKFLTLSVIVKLIIFFDLLP
jgi:hypothetical protein